MPERTRGKPLGFKRFAVLALFTLGAAANSGTPANSAHKKALVERQASREDRFRILWRDPGDARSRDLFYGIGGIHHAPPAQAYRFVHEDSNGSQIKFDVSDPSGVRWKVKIGPEAQGEVAATRLVFAAGYFTDEDYFVPEIHVQDMPLRLKRNKKLIFSNGVVKNVRMEREIRGQKKVGYWKWSDRRILNQRELNGLKVLMALINNWDLKDINTAIYKRQNAAGGTDYIYAVSDLGASFGATHLDRRDTKANLLAYETSDFIAKKKAEDVTFATPGPPTRYLLIEPQKYFDRRGLRSITRDIPRSDARWIGQVLSKLSSQQIRDAFRAAGFSPDQTEGFARVVEERIETLRQL